MPRVSVIIPTFNRAVLLKAALRTVVAQTYKDFEIIVADDGSTENISQGLAEIDPRIRYVRQENRGHEGATRNLGLRASNGELLAFLDSDDLWHKDKLRLQVEWLDSHHASGMVYTDALCFDDSTGAVLYKFHQDAPARQGWIGPDLVIRDFIPCPSPLLRRRVLDEVGMFSEDPLLRMRTDWDMWLRIAAKYEVGLIAKPLSAYRIHAQNASGLEDPLVFHRSCMAVIRRALTGAPDVYGPVAKAARAAQYRATGGSFLVRGDKARARSMYAQSLRLKVRDPIVTVFFLSTFLNSSLVLSLTKVFSWLRRSVR